MGGPFVGPTKRVRRRTFSPRPPCTSGAVDVGAGMAAADCTDTKKYDSGTLVL